MEVTDMGRLTGMFSRKSGRFQLTKAPTVFDAFLPQACLAGKTDSRERSESEFRRNVENMPSRRQEFSPPSSIKNAMHFR
jgi:hypothetical protein